MSNVYREIGLGCLYVLPWVAGFIVTVCAVVWLVVHLTGAP